MSEAHQPPTLRQAQTALTRDQIAEAARDLFLTRGYVNTSMGAIASAAGVAVQTIYNVVGNKAAVLSAVVDVVAAGPGSPGRVPDLMKKRVDATADLAGMVDVLADWFAEVHPRAADLFRLIREAAAVDPDVAAVEWARAERRLDNYRLAADQARERGGLATGMSDEEAAAVIWSLGHPEVYRSLVEQRGWSLDAYRSWVRTSLGAALR